DDSARPRDRPHISGPPACGSREARGPGVRGDGSRPLRALFRAGSGSDLRVCRVLPLRPVGDV
ncbi:MAG: hypothetical protein AVDCRST_MAG47-3089, partial [uncultured Nocardioidaceae bacterium]